MTMREYFFPLASEINVDEINPTLVFISDIYKHEEGITTIAALPGLPVDSGGYPEYKTEHTSVESRVVGYLFMPPIVFGIRQRNGARLHWRIEAGWVNVSSKGSWGRDPYERKVTLVAYRVTKDNHATIGRKQSPPLWEKEKGLREKLEKLVLDKFEDRLGKAEGAEFGDIHP